MSDAPYLQSIDSDLNDRKKWQDKDEAIIKRRLGERPTKRNKPYPNAPNSVVMLIDDNVRDRTDQEITMILNAPYAALFIPVGNVPPEDVTMARDGFNTFIRRIINYRARKEEAVDTKNARGFAVSKIITEEHPDYGMVPSFETVDPRDLIVPSDTRDIQKAERVTHILRMSVRDLRDRAKNRGWNKAAVEKVIETLSVKTTDGTLEVSESNRDECSTFKITRPLTGLNKSATNSEIVIWEIGHYATNWDVENSSGIVKRDDKCVSWVCPDVPSELLHIVTWREEDDVEIVDIEDQEEFIRRVEAGEELEEIIEVDGKDKPWPYVQHRYEYRSRLWYDTRGIGHLNMDAQIAATAVENAKLVQIDFIAEPMFTGTENSNKLNVKIGPGVILPNGVAPVQYNTNVIQALDFEKDQQLRAAGARAGAGGAVYSSNTNETRKLQMSATEVQTKSAEKDSTSTASVDRFNDADRDLFRQLWKMMREMNLQLPIISNGEFKGVISERIYSYEFIIEPAASAKTMNPALQFLQDKEIVEMNAQYAEVTGADTAAGMKLITNAANPVLANAMFPEAGQGGELPITTTLNAQQQQLDQQQQQIEQNGQRASAAIQLSTELANEPV